VRVRWGEADPAGIVFYPRFYEWFDLATEALFEALGMPWPTFFPERGIVGLPIVESGARFSAPVRYGDVVTVRSLVREVGPRTLRMEHEVWVGERCCATGFEVRAWVLRPVAPGEPLRAGAIPEDVARRLAESPPPP
jgi:4-hydroxybenzoyl-CoA thioesterase